MRTSFFLLTAGLLLAAAGTAQARPVRAALPTVQPLPNVWYADQAEPETPAADYADWNGPDAANPFFYPGDYDPQYGSEGEVADAQGFAEDYGCRPVWNARLNHYVPACN